MLTNDTTRMKMPANSFDPTDPLTAAIRALLFREWDPIGVNLNAECENEYDDYIPAIYQLAVNDISIDDIAAYLSFVERTQMGGNAREDLNRTIAVKIFALGNAKRQ